MSDIPRPLDQDSTLGRLAEARGILAEYEDNWGRRHATGLATQRALLTALGSPASDADALAASLARHEEDTWRRILPSVSVQPQDEPFNLTTRLPEWSLPLPHAWRVVLENGHVLAGEFSPDASLGPECHYLDGAAWRVARLALPGIAETGYHRLELARAGEIIASMPLIIHPSRCYMPARLAEGGRVWGVAAQLYALRDARNWGIGDYADLRRLVEWCAASGAALLGVNPLHALFPHNPAHCSPYSPSSRRYFNILYLAVEEIPELADCAEARVALAEPAFQARLAALRATGQVDYAGVAAAKYTILRLLYRHFRAQELARSTPWARRFAEFRAQGGADLERFALYHALQEHFFARDAALWGWPVWPAAFRDPASPEVQTFAASQREAIEWHLWLQWQAEMQLAAAGRRSYELGLGVGMYFDLAVGVDKAGAEIWAHPELYALEAKVGCPPDDFGPLGQDWGLPPWIPERLRDAAYAPYIAILRANMRHAGALRIDHVMGLLRLYWIPPGMRGDQGAYVAYPFRDLLGILALESQRNRCLVVGEDLGTVPGEVRAALHDLGVLSYRLFYFERDAAGNFQPAEHFPRQALVAAATHDLPPLAGYWLGSDLAARDRLDLFPDADKRQAQYAARAQDRERLLDLLARAKPMPTAQGDAPPNPQALTPDHIAAIHAHLARAPSAIVLAQAEDLLGVADQANLPGTVDEYPNWRRKLPLATRDWHDQPCAAGVLAALRAERP
jgi:(1->4)-alpha-D-glucan 1-alpha-D-glucosylmutase